MKRIGLFERVKISDSQKESARETILVIIVGIPMMISLLIMVISPLFLLLDCAEYLQSGVYEQITGLARVLTAMGFQSYSESWLAQPTDWYGAHKILMKILGYPSGFSLFSIGLIIFLSFMFPFCLITDIRDKFFR